MTRVLISGCRHWQCTSLAQRVITRLKARYGSIAIIEGGAKGVDRAFAEAAYEADVPIETHRADWGQHGKAAGPLRNQAMIDAGADLVIACHRNLAESKGTKNLVGLALAAHIPTYLIDREDGEPAQLNAAPSQIDLDNPYRTSRGTIAWGDPSEPTLEDFDAALILRATDSLPHQTGSVRKKAEKPELPTLF